VDRKWVSSSFYRLSSKIIIATQRYWSFNIQYLYIVPCLNPDGFEYSREHFSFWRKNRRDNGDGTFGVDLNRNFSIGFKKSKNRSSNIYGGPYPFSEPETRAIKNFVDSHENITIALDYHSQGNVFFPAHKFTMRWRLKALI